jgi:hypothetical protein
VGSANLGWRRDEIDVNNLDLLTPSNSWSKWVGMKSPKATLAVVADDSWYVPVIAFSFGKSLFTGGDGVPHREMQLPSHKSRECSMVLPI